MYVEGWISAEKITVGSFTIEAKSRPDLSLWYCDNRKIFWSAAWLAGLFAFFGESHDLATIMFEVIEPKIGIGEFALGVRSEERLHGVLHYGDRRTLVQLYERNGNCGLWSFAFFDVATVLESDDFDSNLRHAKAACEIQLDALVQGFVCQGSVKTGQGGSLQNRPR